MSAAAVEIPAVGRAKPLKVPAHASDKLRNGLQVLAVRKPSVPRVEMRLRIPAGSAFDGGDGARALLLPETLLAGTGSRDSVEIARELQRLGATLDAGVNPDDLVIRGGVLSGNLQGLLDLLSEILRAPSFPGEEVAIARDRVAQEILIQRSQPGAVAGEALRRQLWGKHRYGRGLPSPEAVRRVGAAPIRRFFEGHAFPRGSTMVLVGDLQPSKAGERVEAALRAWRGKPGAARPAPPSITGVGDALLVDRPGAVQTAIKLGGRALPRSHPDHLALSLAVLIFGGYFSSRLFKNIREDKGYTYSPSAAVDHKRGASAFVVTADVGTDVTAAALNEIRYELARMATVTVPQEELDQARRFLAGVTSLSIASQAGFAVFADSLLASGVDLSYLKGFRAGLEAVTPEAVRAVAAEHLSPAKVHTAMVGDASVARGPLETLGGLEVVKGG